MTGARPGADRATRNLNTSPNPNPDRPGTSRVFASGLHTDGHPFSLGAVALLDDVGPGGGAFRVWPAPRRSPFSFKPGWPKSVN